MAFDERLPVRDGLRLLRLERTAPQFAWICRCIAYGAGFPAGITTGAAPFTTDRSDERGTCRGRSPGAKGSPSSRCSPGFPASSRCTTAAFCYSSVMTPTLRTARQTEHTILIAVVTIIVGMGAPDDRRRPASRQQSRSSGRDHLRRPLRHRLDIPRDRLPGRRDHRALQHRDHTHHHRFGMDASRECVLPTTALTNPRLWHVRPTSPETRSRTRGTGR